MNQSKPNKNKEESILQRLRLIEEKIDRISSPKKERENKNIIVTTVFASILAGIVGSSIFASLLYLYYVNIMKAKDLTNCIEYDLYQKSIIVGVVMAIFSFLIMWRILKTLPEPRDREIFMYEPFKKYDKKEIKQRIKKKLEERTGEEVLEDEDSEKEILFIPNPLTRRLIKGRELEIEIEDDAIVIEKDTTREGEELRKQLMKTLEILESDGVIKLIEE